MFKCLRNKFMIQDSFWKRPKNYEKDASDLCLENSNEIISVCKANTDRLQIANEGSNGTYVKESKHFWP